MHTLLLLCFCKVYFRTIEDNKVIKEKTFALLLQYLQEVGKGQEEGKYLWIISGQNLCVLIGMLNCWRKQRNLWLKSKPRFDELLYEAKRSAQNKSFNDDHDNPEPASKGEEWVWFCYLKRSTILLVSRVHSVCIPRQRCFNVLKT